MLAWALNLLRTLLCVDLVFKSCHRTRHRVPNKNLRDPYSLNFIKSLYTRGSVPSESISSGNQWPRPLSETDKLKEGVVGWMAVCELGEEPWKNIKRFWERISASDGRTCLGEAPSRKLKKGLWDAEGLQKPFMVDQIKWRAPSREDKGTP